MPAIVCAQKTAQKNIPVEEDFVRSNIATFGNEIGQITNWVTSMYEVRSAFEQNDPEYRMLSYRIMSGQNFQQNAIRKEWLRTAMCANKHGEPVSAGCAA